MSDVIKYAHSSITTVQNGRTVTGVQRNGVFETMPSGGVVINNLVSSGVNDTQPFGTAGGSGVMFDRLQDRFDEHYGGGAS
tara:strand:+ start:759 stop:1001 length:243 start_codon:yes stop_codon:yes gene_type:complete